MKRIIYAVAHHPSATSAMPKAIRCRIFLRGNGCGTGWRTDETDNLRRRPSPIRYIRYAEGYPLPHFSKRKRQQDAAGSV